MFLSMFASTLSGHKYEGTMADRDSSRNRDLFLTSGSTGSAIVKEILEYLSFVKFLQINAVHENYSELFRPTYKDP